MNRTIAIGDIHGCDVALHALLMAVSPTLQDTLVLLGDYVDRGLHSDQVLETLTDLVSRCNVIPLIGNHEIMMVSASKSKRDLDYWIANGGLATIHSYGGRIQNIPQHHWAFLNHCVRYYENAAHFFVHASYDPDRPLDEQPSDVLFWTHILDDPPGPHISGKKAIVGHTPQENHEIRDWGHLAIIDTSCVDGGWLTAIDVGSGQVWQTDNLGHLRQP
jgi:serine/threonine protein phosphatase 1